MTARKPQKPRQPQKGWIYKIDPYRVSIRCKFGHVHIYDLTEPGEVECKTISCSLTLNSSHVFRGFHPYVVWSGEDFQRETGYIKTFIAIPLTSQTTFTGLPTTYPLVTNTKNGLTKKSFALVNQICSIDGNCFKDDNGDWLERIGQLDTKEREGIEKRLRYVLDLSSAEPSEDWFRKNASPELVQKVYGYLPSDLKSKVIENLLEDL